MVNQRQAIDRLDTLIKQAKDKWYNPIQIAEILYRDRVHGPLDLQDLASYRNSSNAWRDDITMRFSGNVNSSSRSYQTSLFVTQIPPLILEKLGTINRKDPGTVEKRIYDEYGKTLTSLADVYEYISKVKLEDFTLREYTKRFEGNGGLKNSMDKAYEIAVYSLFDSLLNQIEPIITVTIPEESREIHNEFRDFTKLTMNVGRKDRQAIHAASVYRVGVANAADAGIDMWTNFGPAIQVKHTIMGQTGIEEIVKQLAPAKVIIVCREAEFDELKRKSKSHPQVQGIVTRENLSDWYRKAMRGKHRSEIGARVLSTLKDQFEREFPSTKDDDFRKFYETERKYHLKNSLPRRRVK